MTKCKEVSKMKKNILVRFAILISVILLISTGSFADDTFSFTESYKENGACFPMFGKQICFSASDSGKFSIKAKISMSGIDISKFNNDTKFVIEAGGLYYEVFLGDDLKYQKSKTKRGFSISPIYWSDDTGKPIKYITIKLKWNDRYLNVSISGVTPDYIDPIAADAYMGEPSGKITGNTNAYIEFGDLYAGFYINNYTGKVLTKQNIKKGQDTGSTSTVSIKGQGRVKEISKEHSLL